MPLRYSNGMICTFVLSVHLYIIYNIYIAYIFPLEEEQELCAILNKIFQSSKFAQFIGYHAL